MRAIRQRVDVPLSNVDVHNKLSARTNTHLCGQIDCGWEVSSIEERLRPRHLLLGHFNLLQLRGVTRSRISGIDWTKRVRGGESRLSALHTMRICH